MPTKFEVGEKRSADLVRGRHDLPVHQKRPAKTKPRAGAEGGNDLIRVEPLPEQVALQVALDGWGGECRADRSGLSDDSLDASCYLLRDEFAREHGKERLVERLHAVLLLVTREHCFRKPSVTMDARSRRTACGSLQRKDRPPFRRDADYPVPREVTVQSRTRKENRSMRHVRFVGLDVHAATIAVAVAESPGEVRSLGTIANRPDAVRRLVRKLGPADELRKLPRQVDTA